MEFVDLIQKLGSKFSLADGIVLLLFLITLCGIRKAPKGKFFNDPLNRGQGLALRGVFSIVVVMKHISGFALNENGILASRCMYWGPLAVSVFFGLSGYGLMWQCRNRSNYLDGFWGKRFHVLWPPYCVVMLLSCAQWLRGDFSMCERLKTQFGPVDGGWFWTVLMAFYLVFWLATQQKEQNVGSKVTLTIAGVLLVTVLASWVNWGWHHFVSNGAFIAGLVLGAYHEKGCCLLREHWRTLISILCVIVMFHLSDGMHRWAFEGVRSDSYFFMNMFWFLGIVALGMKWQLGNRVLVWMGTISYELYLVHMWVMNEFYHWWPRWLGSGYAWTVMGTSLVMAWVLHVGLEHFGKDNRNGGMTSNRIRGNGGQFM